MEMKVRFGDPILIFVYSVSLLAIGDAIGIFWRSQPVTAFSVALLGASLMVAHDTLMTFISLLFTARWVQAVRGQKQKGR